MSGSESSPVNDELRHLKIPRKAIRELEQLTKTPVRSEESPPASAPSLRFYTALLVVTTFGSSNLILNFIPPAFQNLALFIGLIAWEWSNLYGDALSRQRHAFFNVRNVLETYQPRARTHGHLFQPEPDTPRPPDCCPAPNQLEKQDSVTQVVGQALINEMTKSGTHVSEFDKNVHDHYAGMYSNIRRINAEQELLRANKAAIESGPAKSDAGTPDAKLIPADIPLPGFFNKPN